LKSLESCTDAKEALGTQWTEGWCGAIGQLGTLMTMNCLVPTRNPTTFPLFYSQ